MSHNKRSDYEHRLIEELVERWECAWSGASPPAWAPVLEELSHHGASVRAACLLELVLVDLEYRWRRAGATPVSQEGVAPRIPDRPLADDYLEHFPELADGAGPPVALIREEYRVRRRWGDRPSAEQLLARFPQRRQELAPELATVDGELAAEASSPQQGWIADLPVAGLPLADRPTMELPAGAGPATPGADLDETWDTPRNEGVEPPTSPLAPGREFGDYELVEEIARGGMGVVFKARQKRLQRWVALKMIKSGELAGDEEIRRFQTEAAAAAQLDHPHIVPVFEVGARHGVHFFSMGLVEGESLQQRLTRGPLAPREAAELVRKLALAVQYAHERGIVHRDLKPGNILLARGDASAATGTGERGSSRLLRDEPRITDFGLAKHVSGDSELTATGQILGTPAYMAPEQAAGRSDQVGPAADVYALGAVLYCSLTARPPFQAATIVETLRQVIDAEPVPPSHLNRQVDRDLETICLRCLEKPRSRRYSSAAALAEDLDRFLAGEPIQARPVGRIERTVKWVRRRPLVAGLLFAIALLLSVGTIVSSLLAVQASEAARLARKRSADLADANSELGRTNVDLRAANNRAETERGRAVREESRARVRLYAALIGAAHRAWQAHDLPGMLESLRRCEPELRGWEHDYLSRLSRANQSMLSEVVGHARVIALSPDGNWLAVGTGDGDLHIWDAESGRPHRRWPAHRGEICGLCWSPDSLQLASIGLEGELRVWRLDAEAPITQLTDQVLTCVDFDGQGRLVTGALDGSVQLWNPDTGERLGRREALTDRINVVACSAGGRVAVAGAEGKLELLAGADLPPQSLPGHGDWITALAVRPDGQRLASAGDDGLIRLWDCERRVELAALAGHSAPVAALSLSAAGDLLASGAFDGTVRLWDMDSGAELQTFVGHLGPVRGVEVDPRGQWVFSCGEDGTVRRWRLDGQQGPQVIDAHEGVVSALAVAPQGNALATAGWDRRVLYVPVDGSAPGRYLSRTNQAVESLIFSNQGDNVLASDSLGSIRLLNVQSGEAVVARSEQSAGICKLAISDSGDQWCSAGRDGVKIWDSRTAELVVTLEGAPRAVTQVAFAPDGGAVFAAGEDGRLLAWDIESRELRLDLQAHAEKLHAFAIRPDGELVATAGEDRVIRIWDARDGSLRATLNGHSAPVHSLVYLPAGDRLVSGAQDNTVRIWHPETETQLLALHGRGAPGACLGLLGGGAVLVSGGWDGAITIWHGATSNAGEAAGASAPDDVRWRDTGEFLAAAAHAVPADFDPFAAAVAARRELRVRTDATEDHRAYLLQRQATLFENRGLLARSEHYWRQYAAEWPDQRVGRRRLGTVLLRQGRDREAREILRTFWDELLVDLRDGANGKTRPAAGPLLEGLSEPPPIDLPNNRPNTAEDGLEFDGNGTYCVIPTLYFNGRPPWTLEAIVTPRRVSSTWSSLISTVDAGGITLSISSDIWRIGLYTARVGFHQYDSYSRAFDSGPVELGRRQHVAGVWDGQELRFFRDGELQGVERDVNLCSQLSGFPFFLGADPSIISAVQGHFEGRLFAVRISRAARYQDSFPAPATLAPDDDAEAVYEFHSELRGHVPDLSGHGHHALLFGPTGGPAP